MDISFLIVALLFVFGPYIIAGFLARRISKVEKAARGTDALIRDLETVGLAQAEEIAVLRREIRELRGLPPEEDAGFDSVAAGQPAPAAEAAVAAGESVAVNGDAQAEADGGPVPPSEGRIGRWLRGGGLERQFGAVLPVWIGGIALAFAGFFLVKYSIENDLVGPQMRTVLGMLLGIGLIGAAHWVGYRVRVESAGRIAQSLAGAGIAVLYVSSYAASALYGLVPPVVGFFSLAAVTAVAVVLSLRHGPPIALLGLLGGMLTPALVHSDEPSAMLLFLYLYAVFAGFMIVVRRQGWWFLALPAVLLAFFWVVAWLVSDAFRPDEVIWAGLFLAGVAGTLVAASRERYTAELSAVGSWRGLLSLRNRAFFLNTVALAGAFALFGVLAFNANFGLHDWVLFGVIATGVIALAWFDAPLYGFAPWAAMAVNLLMLAGWQAGPREIGVTVAAFGALYVLSGLLLFPGAAYPLLWAGLATASGIGYYLLAYFRMTEEPAYLRAEEMPAPVVAVEPPAAAMQPALPGATATESAAPPVPPVIDTPPNSQPVEPLVEGVRAAVNAVPYVWGAIAFALAALFFGAAVRAARVMAPSAVKDRVLAAFALATTAFVALGLSVELEREFLSVAIAAELLAVVWVAGRTGIPSLRPIAGLLGLVFAFLLIPQILLLFQIAFYSLLDIRIHLVDSIPLVDYPLFQLALPAVLFLAAAWLLRKQEDGRLVRALEGGAVALIGLFGFYVASKLFHPGENVLFAESSFLERAVVTNVLFAFGVACLIAGRWFGRIAFTASGGILAGIALFRVLYIDLFLKNPLWTHVEIPGSPLANALVIAFGLPILWSWIAAQEAGHVGGKWLSRLARWTPGLMLLLAFAWLSFEVRRVYQGPFLDGSDLSDAELYSYSAAWLIFGLGLLFFGTLRGNQMLRFASLAVMLATVSKVFLVDAGNLTGLFLVFSFLGLGLSLIGLSYFYSRFVFGAGGSGDAAPDGNAAPGGTSAPGGEAPSPG